MANKKKEVELTKTKIVNKEKIELVKIDPQDLPIEKVEVSIFDKYRNLINMAKSDFNLFRYSSFNSAFSIEAILGWDKEPQTGHGSPSFTILAAIPTTALR